MTTNREAQLLLDAVTGGIESPKELANFMAQVTHESLDLRKLQEGFRYTKSIAQIPVDSALRQGPEALESARLEALRGAPEQLAELMYGGRMGNDGPGDGFKYRGRGYIQLTGKNNYLAAGEALGLDLVRHPELAAEPNNASKIAVWYWNKNVHHVAPENVTAATRIVNNGHNGLPERKARFAQWESKLTPELMASLTGREALIPVSPMTHPHTTAKIAVRGESILELQNRLNELGYADAHGNALKPDGHFGANTLDAVKAFQLTHGLTPDGIAGANTLSKLDVLVQQTRQAQQAPAEPIAQLDNAQHPDHTLFKQALGAVHRIDFEYGRTPDQRSEQLAASLVVAARSHGMNRIDHAELSTDASKVFLVKGTLNSPLKQIISVPTVASLDAPIAQSTHALDQVVQQKKALEQQQHVQQPEQQRHQPALSMQGR